MTTSECPHENLVYSGERWCTGTPLWHWICRDCKGLGTTPSKERPSCDLLEYASVLGTVDHEASVYYMRIVTQRLNQPLGGN